MCFPKDYSIKTSLGHFGDKTFLGFPIWVLIFRYVGFLLCAYYLEVIRVNQNWCRYNDFTGPVHLGGKWERLWTYLNIYPGKRKRWFHNLFLLLPHTYQKAQGIQELWHNGASRVCQREGSSRIYSPIHLVQQLRPSSLQFPVWIPLGAYINAALSSGLIQCYY